MKIDWILILVCVLLLVLAVLSYFNIENLFKFQGFLSFTHVSRFC
jgi:hypothetical protein